MTGAVPPAGPEAAPLGAPPPEVDVTEPLVRALLREQHPDLAELPLSHVTTGWDNAIWRLGDHLAVRLPVRAVAAPLVAHEQRWLPVLAPSLPVATPLPVRGGLPGGGYPWRWSVVPWLAGTPADRLPPGRRDPWAEQLGVALAALHRPAPPDAPANPFRGVPLTSVAGRAEARIAAYAGPERPVLRALWHDGLAAPARSGPAVWLHGDPHPANLLVAGGRLSALLDFGDVTSGDPASDLATAWLCFSTPARARFWAAYDEARTAAGEPAAADAADGGGALRRRSRAWAVSMALVMLADPDTHPGLATVGAHAVRELASAADQQA